MRPLRRFFFGLLTTMAKKQKQLSAREIKEGTVADLTEKVSRAKTLAFADYRGLTVNQVSELRKKIKEAGGEMLVTKNTLMQRALSGNKIEVELEKLAGPTATIFAYEDEIAPIKTVAEAGKVTGLPAFKFGFFNKDFLDVNGLKQLATIPSKIELQAKVVGALSSPIYGIASVLQANIRNIVYVLDQVAKSKS